MQAKNLDKGLNSAVPSMKLFYQFYNETNFGSAGATPH